MAQLRSHHAAVQHDGADRHARRTFAETMTRRAPTPAVSGHPAQPRTAALAASSEFIPCRWYYATRTISLVSHPLGSGSGAAWGISDLAQAPWLGTGNAETWASDTKPRPRVSPAGAACLPRRLRQHKDNCSGMPVPIAGDKSGVSSHWILYRMRVTHEKWIFL